MNKFDINALNASLKKLLSPQSMGDLNDFIEKMPVRVGYPALIAGCVAWFIGGLAVVYATTVAQSVADIRAELVKSEALKPVVAQLVRKPVKDAEIDAFIEKIDPLYPNVQIQSLKNGRVKLSANSGRYFGAFREAVNHTYNGGQRWRLQLESLCVGRECEESFLSGVFKISTLKIER